MWCMCSKHEQNISIINKSTIVSRNGVPKNILPGSYLDWSQSEMPDVYLQDCHEYH